MNLEFLVFANLLLLARLLGLFKEEVASGRAWAGQAAAEILALAVLYPFSGVWFGAAGIVLLVNFLGWRWESLPRRRRNWSRLLLGFGALAALSVCFAPAFGLGFRPAIGRLGSALHDWTTLMPLLRAAGNARFHLGLFGLLLAGNEANLIIRAVFDWLDVKPRMRASTPGATEVDEGEYNRGRVIGLLERALIYFFVLQGQLGAIGFTLAAKAFTRFKELEDRRFAEYVLIGTLLSLCLALAIGLGARWLLR
jgi:hypothetical protein